MSDDNDRILELEEEVRDLRTQLTALYDRLGMSPRDTFIEYAEPRELTIPAPPPLGV